MAAKIWDYETEVSYFKHRNSTHNLQWSMIFSLTVACFVDTLCLQCFELVDLHRKDAGQYHPTMLVYSQYFFWKLYVWAYIWKFTLNCLIVTTCLHSPGTVTTPADRFWKLNLQLLYMAYKQLESFSLLYSEAMKSQENYIGFESLSPVSKRKT